METPEDLIRCSWCGKDPLYIDYHDKEWGKAVSDDRILFEFLILESAQAGLSWITILKRRENYRNAFAQFDVEKVANFDSSDIEKLMHNEGIIRNRLKITSSISNAKLFMQIQQESGSFYAYLYSFMPANQSIQNKWETHSQVPASTELSDTISKDLKKRGLKFFGTTICYAFMQATGMVNDHIESCSFR
ncbi:DNA-3-methyladenine glycosylase [Arcticibacter svalbardensis MN12-7]|uniref:DNA-3-methyladenine glycosylase I n=1 Tax=Arcticibacter svalbardensis MN12-7 TaxID=1150600 RepID=R9GPY8_9SPHI|nr:DNA-3-methyladenine glycosylase [Arcticibacter svalbardensis MN12-7]